VAYQENSVINKISGARQMIIEKLKAGDVQKAKEAYDYLETKIDSNTYGILYVDEMFKLAIIFKEYDVIRSTQAIGSMVLFKITAYEHRLVLPQEDGMSNVLDGIIFKNRDVLLKEADTILNEEETEFLTILIDHLIENYAKGSQDDTNKKADNFFTKYPHSKYEQFIRYYIRFVQKKSDSGLGVSCGLSNSFYSKEISDYVSNSFGFSASVDYFYRNMMFALDITNDSVSTLKKTVVNGTDNWLSGKEVFLACYSIQAAIKIKYTDKICFFPFIGLANYELDSGYNEKERGFVPKKLTNNSIICGVCYDMILGNKNVNIDPNKPENMEFRLRIKFTAGNPELTDNIKGTRYSIGVNIVMAVFTIERDL
jgi:hypothetical protein